MFHRLEYDAYRNDIEALQLGPRETTPAHKLEEAQRKFEDHKAKFEKLRGDVSIKLKFLDENRVFFPSYPCSTCIRQSKEFLNLIRNDNLKVYL